MKRGDIIKQYRILQDFTSAGGGLSKWTFAEKEGREYFIKEFLHPTYPLPASPGSEKVKTRKLKECRAFESHHLSLMEVIDGTTHPGGNLISTLDFFRYKAKYYKVTEKVDVTSLKPAQIAALPLGQRVLIMATIAHSLRILHRLDVVHGDLKLDNVLIKQTRMGNYTSKLIDFDDSYFSQKPPTIAEQVVGDLVFYSPELGRYIREEKGTAPEDLTTQSDIFALGLLYTLYLSGKLPSFDRKKFHYPWIAVNQGEKLSLDKHDLPESMSGLITEMLHPEFEKRPPIDEIFLALRSQIKKPSTPKKKAPKEIPVVKDAPDSSLKGKLKKPEAPIDTPVTPPSPPEKASPPDPSTRLKGSLIHPKSKKK